MVNNKDEEMQSLYPELYCECEDVSVHIDGTVMSKLSE